jgi:hypothetical protein
MPPKPHRMLLDRVTGYADEAAAYLRRRRHMRKPFARVYFAGGRSSDFSSETDAGKALFTAAARVIATAGPTRRAARQARAGVAVEREADRDELDDAQADL